MSEFRHQPVLLKEAIDLLNVKPGGNYLDATLGGGGHAGEILRRNGPQGRLIGIDRDPEAIAAAGESLKAYGPRITLLNTPFSRLSQACADIGCRLDGALFDLGVSSPQIDAGRRGFSFTTDGPLDMRMGEEGPTAADLVNDCSQLELAGIFFKLGEERESRKIARAITAARGAGRIGTTGQLSEIIRSTAPRMPNKTLARIFQALRIKVNRELEELADGLRTAIEVLDHSGRIVVISYHSLEDRIVKEKFQAMAHPCTCPSNLPACVCHKKPAIKILTKKPIVPAEKEISSNSRARSAKLRAAQKI
jgi:16S rRNA (cytosine1402-N4)-methyltransferase